MARVEIEEAELAALKRQVAKLEADAERTKDYDAVKGELGTVKTRLGELNAGREKAAFESVGVNSEKAQKFLRLEFESLPAEGKPADVVAWLEAFRADTTKIPADLASFIKPPTPGAQPGAAGGQPERPPVTVPNMNAGTQAPPVGGAKWTAEAVRQMTPDEYAARRAEIVGSSPQLQAMTRGLPGLDSPAAPAAPPAR